MRSAANAWSATVDWCVSARWVVWVWDELCMYECDCDWEWVKWICGAVRCVNVRWKCQCRECVVRLLSDAWVQGELCKCEVNCVCMNVIVTVYVWMWLWLLAELCGYLSVSVIVGMGVIVTVSSRWVNWGEVNGLKWLCDEVRCANVKWGVEAEVWQCQCSECVNACCCWWTARCDCNWSCVRDDVTCDDVMWTVGG